ncbi:hypothetical protein DMN91_009053 [Ooceraea biroi]|uniref:DUF4780 domain-containing protein n=1 Tax=Ooceraea biroi TaxID=2015173 RepID=A0A3L8DEI3_OOCBI|nr:uncharacterized protein LOC105276633 [Ooceraea biroi]XP_026828508.1 uncharacterized protein LOC105276633 [Ooceraea biroi]XP_026828509.1 uncharacterized protein LOC105276633 [Ooceraea biroi]XP_026828510.1 uncharacterized protein LOC105276633 [Ooceraea biroi]XP_026828511.1 uncharacterized protein LOC105276633 [Ooceraea biroi]RLU18696.1 hypothetical protein DMN91_009053 [Ooceraea biroi]
MAIINTAHPEQIITEEQAQTLKEWLLQKVKEAESEELSPRFLECRLRGSALLISCYDQATRDWLERRLREDAPTEPSGLRLIEAKDLTQPIKAMVFIPGPVTDPKKIWRRIALRNKPLNTEGWQTISQKEEPKGQLLVIRMEKTSWDKLGEVAQYRPFLNFGRVEFKPLIKKGEPPEKVPTTMGIVATTATTTTLATDMTMEVEDEQGASPKVREEGQP